jgi:hypothetical protein
MVFRFSGNFGLLRIMIKFIENIYRKSIALFCVLAIISLIVLVYPPFWIIEFILLEVGYNVDEYHDIIMQIRQLWLIVVVAGWLSILSIIRKRRR